MNFNDLKLKKIKLLIELFNLRMQKGTGQLTKNHMFKYIRCSISRINRFFSDERKKNI